MPNWCLTNYTIVGEEKELDELYSLMRNLEEMETPLRPNCFGSDWLGCLIVALGEKWEDNCCRGYWRNLERGNRNITFETKTAWKPANDVFELLKRKFPSLKYCFYAEEPDGCIYETNDAKGEFYPNRLYVDLFIFDEICEQKYFKTDEQMFEWIGIQIGQTVSSAEEVTEHFNGLNKKGKSAYCEMYRILVVDR